MRNLIFIYKSKEFIDDINISGIRKAQNMLYNNRKKKQITYIHTVHNHKNS